MIARVALPAAAMLLTAALPAQFRGPFSKRIVDEHVVVSANAPAQPCDRALGDLAKTMDWRLRWQFPELRDEVGDELVDLAFADLDPRHVARLMAISAGVEAVFNEREYGVDLVIVQVPGAESAAGRQQLRAGALDWYRRFLVVSEHASDPDNGDALDARYEIAEILRDRGEFVGAAKMYEQVYQLAPFSAVGPRVLLRLAECYYEMGDEALPESQRYAMKLLKVHGDTPEEVAALALYGRILLRQGLAEACAETLQARLGRGMPWQPEMIDVHLVLMEAWFRLDRPADCAVTVADLAVARDAAAGRQDPLARRLPRPAELPLTPLTEEQFTLLEFFEGWVAVQRGDNDRGVLHLRRYFASAGEREAHRPVAFVLLGRAYLGKQRFMQARAAAMRARDLRGAMDARWARRCSELWAAALLALGEEDTVFPQLELDVREDDEGGDELALHLAQLYADEGRYARSVRVLDEVAERGDELGDRACVLQIEALLAQSRELGQLRSFPAKALPIARRVSTPQHSERLAALFGAVYEELGEVEKAADALRGVLR